MCVTMYVILVNYFIHLHNFARDRYQKMGFWAPVTKRPRVGGVQYELVMAQGIC